MKPDPVKDEFPKNAFRKIFPFGKTCTIEIFATFFALIAQGQMVVSSWPQGTVGACTTSGGTVNTSLITSVPDPQSLVVEAPELSVNWFLVPGFLCLVIQKSRTRKSRPGVVAGDSHAMTEAHCDFDRFHVL